MNTLRKLALTLAVAGLVGTASAASIAGQIYFTGAATLAGGSANAATATSISFTNPVDVTEAISTGNYSGYNSSVGATLSGFTFGAVGNLVLGAPVSPLWILVGGNSVAGTSFTLNTLTTNSYDAGSNTRLLAGFGVAYMAGLDPTLGYWTLSSSGSGTSIAFSSNTQVPDGGSTMVLLGLGLVGIAGLRRWFQKK